MLHDAWISQLENESDPDDAAKGVRAYTYDLLKRIIKEMYKTDLSKRPCLNSRMNATWTMVQKVCAPVHMTY